MEHSENELTYIFLPNIEIEYIFNNIDKSLWESVFNYLSFKYPNSKSSFLYTDYFYPLNIRSNKFETIEKLKLNSYIYSVTDCNIPVKCKVSTENPIVNPDIESQDFISFRKKNKTRFSFKYYSLDLSHIISSNEDETYEIEMELNIHKCRLESIDNINNIIKKDLDSFVTSFINN